MGVQRVRGEGEIILFNLVPFGSLYFAQKNETLWAINFIGEPVIS